jgi:methanol metabolism-related c-type cytochrome
MNARRAIGAGRLLYPLCFSNKDRLVHISSLVLALSFALLVAWGAPAMAEPPGDAKAVKEADGKYVDAKGDPTFNVKPDGTVDWYTYSGFRRYHSECHVCHGPDGEGSTYAPALKDSLTRMNYAEFYGIVVGGKQDLGAGENKVMPALGDNKNVMCYIDDIYVYLRARSADAIGRGRPEKHEDKSPQAKEGEAACFGEKS